MKGTAVLLSLSLCTVLLGCRPGDAPQPNAGARPTIEALAPVGTTAFPFELTWKALDPGPDAVFRLTIYDGAERQIFETDTRAPSFKTPPDLRPLFSATPRFLWRVAVLDAYGNVVARTGLVECTVK